MATAQQKIKVLKLARARIKTRVQGGHPTDTSGTAICFALNNVSLTDADWAATCEIKGYIHYVLGQKAYLADWIKQNRKGYRITFNSMKEARIQWIDWMIAEYEKQK